MTKPYDITTFSRERLVYEQSSADTYTYILIVGALITFVASIFQNFHSDRVSQLKTLQVEQLEQSQNDFKFKIATLTESTAMANARAEESILKQKEVEKENLKLKTELRRETENRQELAKSVAPRTIDVAGLAEQLKKYEGTKLILETSIDPEAQRLGSQLMETFSNAKWKVSTIQAMRMYSVPDVDRGVWVQISNKINLQTSKNPLIGIGLYVATLLKQFGLDVTNVSQTDEELGEDQLKIHIGNKPYKAPIEK